MEAVVGPILNREGGYAFDYWTSAAGLIRGYAYRRIEDAYYARRVESRSDCGANGLHSVICDTVEEFCCEIADREVPFFACPHRQFPAM